MFDNDVSIGFSSNFYSDILSNLYIITGHYNTFGSAFAHFSDQFDANRSVCTCYSMPSVKVPSLLEACLDLTSFCSPSMEIQIMGGKITENLGFESPLWKVKKLFVLFQILHKKWISCFTNQISTCFIWFLNNKTRYQNMIKIKDTQFCVKNWKWKEKKDNKFLTFQSGDSNPRFSVTFPPMIWIFVEGEGYEIKSRLGSS